jgi:esterase
MRSVPCAARRPPRRSDANSGAAINHRTRHGFRSAGHGRASSLYDLYVTTRDPVCGSCYDTRVEATFRFTTSDGAVLHYKLLRAPGVKRPVLVLLHGLSSNLTRWSEFIEHTTLKERFDILRLDLRGHAESFTRGRISMEIWTRDLAELLAYQGYERAVLVGHSLGANVALWFAAKHPQHVAGLALIDPTLTEALRGQALLLRRISWLIRAVVALLRLLNALGLKRAAFPPRDLRQLDEQMRKQFLSAGKETDFVKRYTSPLADIKHFSTAHYLQEVIEITRPIPHIERIATPLLALISQGVTFTDLEKTKAALARCPQSQIIVLTAYHWPLTEKPVEVRTAIENWATNLA